MHSKLKASLVYMRIYPMGGGRGKRGGKEEDKERKRIRHFRNQKEKSIEPRLLL